MTAADPTATALTDRLEAALGPVLVGTRPRPFGAPGAPLPVVRPGDRAALAELVGLARAEGLTLAPLGAGTKVDRTPPPPGLDLYVDTGAFARVLAFEPGDGTLTAEAGARMDDLVALAAGGDRAIVPAVAPGATLGGVLATAEAGADRLLRGPLREHVLGLEVLLSDGRTSRSGGRLVKNVAGYDLHRLHLGAWGGLGLILEATLRLFPVSRREVRLAVEVPDVPAGLELAAELRAARPGARRLHLARAGAGPTTLHLDLAGRAEAVEADLAACASILGTDEPLPPSPPDPRPDLVLHALPSRAPVLADLAAGLLADGTATGLVLDPLLARVALHTDSPPDLAALPAGVHRSLPRPDATPLPEAARPLARAVETALDPTGTWARA